MPGSALVDSVKGLHEALVSLVFAIKTIKGIRHDIHKHIDPGAFILKNVKPTRAQPSTSLRRRLCRSRPWIVSYIDSYMLGQARLE